MPAILDSDETRPAFATVEEPGVLMATSVAGLDTR